MLQVDPIQSYLNLKIILLLNGEWGLPVIPKFKESYELYKVPKAVKGEKFKKEVYTFS